MKAIVYREYGSPGVLSLQDIPVPVPGDDEVLVKVHASSVNDYDWHLLTGKPFVNRAGGLFRPRHEVLGSDVAGSVAAAGPAVTRFRPGDEVFGDMSPCGFGAFAEYVRAPQGALALKPAGLSFQQAAAVPQAGGLAVLGLRGRHPIRPGDEVLINGAGGGVGTFAVQIAKAHGAEVTGVDRAGKLDTVRAVGADHVIDFTTEDFTRNRRAYDLIVDVAAHRPMSAYRRSLRPGGVCAIIGGSIPRIFLALALGPGLSLLGSKKVGVPLWRPNNPQDIAFLTRLLQARSVAPVVDRVFPLSEAAAAFRRFGAQQHTGKIVITI
jgi:NADPH:quinone reductase-like Zn-dependent oxidoreductase